VRLYVGARLSGRIQITTWPYTLDALIQSERVFTGILPFNGGDAMHTTWVRRIALGTLAFACNGAAGPAAADDLGGSSSTLEPPLRP
jgi:hypothetical protein